jgi:hypothetical protein
VQVVDLHVFLVALQAGSIRAVEDPHGTPQRVESMGTAPLNASVDQAAAWIRSYLSEHPKAADTAEGIQRWWLAPNYGEVALVTVEMALATLEGEGVVMIPDPLALRPTYGLRPTRGSRS